MRKVYSKLVLSLMALLVSLVMVVSVTYAWMTLSNSPAAEGIQITIGGGNTILIAADQTREADGIIYHYPGAFEDTLNFSQSTSYDYLKDSAGLNPVSTADGINWFIPTYYDLTDPEVQEGTVLSGLLKPVDQFIRDNTLTYANLGADETEIASSGSYLYLDFWVVSPGSDYLLRISTGEDSNGSYVIGLPEAVEQTDGGYTLSSVENNAEACVRIGFLANPNYITDETMWYYQNSAAYSAEYSRLRGYYQEPGGTYVDNSGSRFTIYEPNADLHPTIASAQGNYLVTRPLGWFSESVLPVDVGSLLTVQKRSTWTDALMGEGTQLEHRFQTAALEPSFRGLTPAEMTQRFYGEYLEAQVGPYVSTGAFIKNTGNLYNAVGVNGMADASFLGDAYTANVTDDVYIVKLEKNVPQRIRMFIWIEGQDADCVNSVEASSFALSIELAGSNDDLAMQSTELQEVGQNDALPAGQDTQNVPPEDSGPERDPGSEPETDT